MFVNVVGGVKVMEISVDLVLFMVLLLSFCDCLLLKDVVVFGEVGLVGEICFVLSG